MVTGKQKKAEQEAAKETAVVEVGNTAAAMRDSEDALEVVLRRDELFKQVLKVAMAATKSSDWKDYDGTPYLEATGCEKVALRFGMSVTNPRYEPPHGEDFEDAKGKYYMYTCYMDFRFGHQQFTAVGTCSSRDKFFGKANSQLKPLDQVERTNIKKKAYTNCFQNGIKRALGLRGLSWEDLKEYNIHREGKGSVSYSKKGRESVAEGEKAPFWDSEYKGKKYLWARAGQTYSPEFLSSLGFQINDKKTAYFRIWDAEALAALESQAAGKGEVR